MATNIPPHNLREIVQATTALIDDPDNPTEAETAALDARIAEYQQVFDTH